MKKVTSFVLCIALIIGLCIPTYAASSSADDQILLDFGYPYEIVSTMESTAKSDIASAIRSNPANVEMFVSVEHFDEFSGIRSFVTATDAERLQMGYTEADICEMKEHLEERSVKTDEQLKTIYNRSDQDIHLLRLALHPIQ